MRAPVRRHRAGCLQAVLLAILPGLAPALFAAQDPVCAPDIPGARVFIEYIIDGDTVILDDGTHLRMVGIDTPELGHDGNSDQPGAAAARDWLRSRLTPGAPALVVADSENRDRHGRLLRHVFLPDGTNLQAALLAEGLAMPLVIPPSLRFLPCYQQAADSARASGAGLWELPGYQSADPRTLGPETRGFRIVRDRVVAFHRTRGGAWLELEGPVSVTIPASDFDLFDRAVLEALPGRRAEFRGMVYPHRGRLRLYLRHPVNLIEPAAPGNSIATYRSK